MKITSQDASIALDKFISGSWEGGNVSIDSRTVKPGELFFAIKGKNFDGHDFLDEVKSKKAVAAIVEHDVQVDIPTIIVQDSIQALQDLARYKRKYISSKVIAITGSVGKTTTKEMVYLALVCHGKAYRNPGNLNNHIGLPLSLLNAPNDAEYIILEMGMNHAGEIKQLSEIAQPDISIITNIGPVHIEFFSSVQDIAKAKAEIFISTREKVILNKDNEYFNYLHDIAKQYKNIIITVGKHKETNIRWLSHKGQHVKIAVNSENSMQYQLQYDLPVIYNHIAHNSLFALAVSYALDLDLEKSAKNLKNFIIQQGRGNIHYKNGITIIDDSYNASLPAMKAALQSLRSFSGRKVAILGDMLELGKESKKLHGELVNIINYYKIDMVYTVGQYMQCLYDSLEVNKRGMHVNKANELNIGNYLRTGDIVLVKGSHSMNMEQIVKNLLLHV